MGEPCSAARASPSPVRPSAARAEAPRGAAMDAYGRAIAYLRLSITDRCNLRCRYCSPALEAPRAAALTPREIGRLVRILARCGVRRVRLTGGEPTLRRDLLAVIDEIRSTPGIAEVALTTNGHRLRELAGPLRRAGLESLNVSLDTLDPGRASWIAGPGARLQDVLRGIDAAAAAGFEHLKVNTVVMGGVNEDELGALARWAWARQASPRFIEKMPFGEGQVVPIARVKRLLMQQGLALQVDARRGWGPAHYMRAADEAGAARRVGFIGAMTESFCGACNRVRVSSTGDLHPCLGGSERVPVRALLRDGSPDGAVEAEIRAALRAKAPRHRMTVATLPPMARMGG